MRKPDAYPEIVDGPDKRSSTFEAPGPVPNLLLKLLKTQSRQWNAAADNAYATHDALTYSAKAATHKNVHPYLRYGIAIGGFDGPVPKRLVRHGHNFDFMMTIGGQKLTNKGRDQLVALIVEEVRSSQTIGRLLGERSDIRLLHRKLEVS
jgi:hypothetical protein